MNIMSDFSVRAPIHCYASCHASVFRNVRGHSCHASCALSVSNLFDILWAELHARIDARDFA